jgi:hypothetical protein
MAKRVPLISLTFGAADTTKESGRISENESVYQGKCTHIKLVIPAFTNNPTLTIEILDSDGDVIFCQAAIADGQTSVIADKSIPLIEREKVRVTLSGAPGGTGGVVTVRLYYLPEE